MANLGNYQVGDELYRTAFTSVCSATPLDAAKSTERSRDFIIKIFDPATSVVDDPSQSSVHRERAAAFMDSARAQQEVATSARFWAPIHESGRGDGKPYFVTNYYARTAQKLLAGRVILNPLGLHEIMQSVVLGLVELQKTCGRAHGNLKPSNVLIGGQGRVTEGKFVLTDPAPGPCRGVEAEAEDLRAVGGLLYQLVMHRPAHATTWPVAESEEWARLGRRGRDWRQLCSDLLSYDPAERKTLAELERAVRKLVPIKIPVVKIAAAVAGCAAVVGAVGFSASRWEQSARAEVVATQEQWFAILQDPLRSGVFEADPMLRDVLADDRSHQELIQSALSAEGWTALKPAVIRQVMEARSISRESRRKWIEAFKKDAADVSDKLGVYRNRGWRIPDRYAKTPTLDENPPAQALVDGAAQLRDLRLRIAGNDPSPRWAELERKLDILRSANDSYATKFADLLRQTAANAISLSDQSWIATAALQRSDGLAAKLIEKGKVDFDANRLGAEEPGINLSSPGLADIERWLGTVDLYVRVPDAGKKAAYDCRTEFIEQIATGVGAHPDQWPKYRTPQFIAERTKIEDDCVALGKGSFLVKDLRLNEENRGPLYDKRIDIRQQIAALRLKYYVVPASPAEFVASLADLNLKDARLKSIWDRNISDLAAKKPGEIPVPQFEDRKVQIQSLQKLLKSLDDFAPVPSLASPYDAIAAARRNEDLAPLLSRLGDGASLRAEQFQSLAADTAPASAGYAQWSNQVKDLARDFAAVPGQNQILEYTRFPDQGWRDASDSQVRGFWQSQVLASTGRFNPLLGPFLARLDKLRAVQDDDLRVVAALATQTNPSAPAEILVAAWRRLAGEGQLARPASIGGLNEEGVIRVNLGGVKSGIDSKKLLASDSLTNDLRQELARGPRRWCDAVKSAGSAAEIHAAMLLTSQFDLNFAIDDKATSPAGKVAIVGTPALSAHTADLGPAASYNVALALAQDAVTARNDGVIPSRLDALMRAADQLLAPARSDFAPLVRWLGSARATYGDGIRSQAAALLQDAMFYFPPTQQPNLVNQALAASGRLKEKEPLQSLALLRGFLPSDRSTLSDAARLQFARQFFDLGNLLPQDFNSQKDAYTQSLRLGNKDAMLAMLQIDKTALAKELKDLADAGNIDAQILLAKSYENGWGVAPSLTEARRYYTLADYRQNAEAHDWLKNHPVQVAPPVVVRADPVYADETDARRTLSQFQSDLVARKLDDATADLRRLNELRDIPPQLKPAIDAAQTQLQTARATAAVQVPPENVPPVTPPVVTPPKHRPRAGN